KSVAFDLAPGAALTHVFTAEARPEASAAEAVGPGRLVLRCLSDAGEEFSQAVETVVRPPYPRVSASLSGSAEAAGATAIDLPVEGYLKGTLEASFALAPSPAIEAARAVRYLQEYPYGCLEQTISKAWLFAAAADLLAALEPGDDVEAHIAAGLDAAVKRLATMRTVNGGFGYWPGEARVYEWGSVYAAHFLTVAGQKTELPAGLKESALDWLRSYLGADYGRADSDDLSYILSTQAYACYVLALNGEYRAGWINALKERKAGLSPSARIFLAGAEALAAGRPEALEELEREKMDFSWNSLGQRHSSLDSPARNLALLLAAWSEVDPLSPTARDLAGRVAEQGRGNYWRNTQENGLAVLALSSYLAKSGAGREYVAVLKSADGQTLFRGDQRQLGAVGPKTLAPALGRPLQLEVEGPGRPYYTLTVAAVPLLAPEPKAEKIALERVWILPDGTRRRLSSLEETAPTLTLRQGDRITVELAVSADEPFQNMVLLELLPGGFEIENPNLVQKEDGEPAAGESADGEPADGQPQGLSRFEMREDRLAIIEPWLSAGQKRPKIYRYSLRAVTVGEYALPPTVAEGMYEPDRQAILAGGRVRVLKRETEAGL
ncbi:MAG: hypothetical protein LBS31_09270, partial [Candidatus Adiutrix sp.]|nr:hypothetical protein [Candidatus Adiutrix sp.]